MLTRKLISLAPLVVWTSLCQAGITVAPGTYEVPALLRNSRDQGIEAVFNFRSAAECRIHLDGKEAAKLRVQGLRGLLIKIQVPETIRGLSGHAVLLGSSALSGKAIPLSVGNDLRPTQP